MQTLEQFHEWLGAAQLSDLLLMQGKLAASLRREALVPAHRDQAHQQLKLVREQLFRLERQARSAVPDPVI